MQKRLLLLFSSLCLSLTGCGSIKNENAIHAIMNNEGQVIELKATSLEYMIKQKYSFPVLMYTEQCSYCAQAKENLSKLATKSNYAFYQIEMFEASIEYLSSILPNYFSSSDTYPFIYLFNEGNISYKSKVNDITNYTNLSKMMKSYLIDTKIESITTLDQFNAYKKVNQEYLLFTYDSSVKEEKYIYSNYLYSASIKSNKNVLIIDKMTAKSDLINQINHELEGEFNKLSIYSSSKIKTTLNYASSSGNEIETFIASYF